MDTANDPKQQIKTLQQQLNAIGQISQVLLSGSSVEQSLSQIINLIPSVLGTRYIGILLLNNVDEDQQIYKFNLIKTSMPGILEKVVEWAIGRKVREVPYATADPQSVFVQALREKKVVVSTDVYRSFLPIMSEGAANRIKTLTSASIKSLVGAPLLIPGKALGVIALGWGRDHMTNTEIEILTTFANQAAIALYNARLFQQNKEQIQQLAEQKTDLQSLYDFTSKIGQSLDPLKVAQSAVDALPQDEMLLGANISQYNPNTGEIVNIAVTQNEMAKRVENILGDFSKYVTNIRDPKVQKSPIVQAVQTGIPHITEDLATMMSPPIPAKLVPPVAKLMNMKSIVAYPITSHGKVSGAIAYFLKELRYSELPIAKQRMLYTYAIQISIALENANLFQESQIIQLNLQHVITQLQEARRKERDMLDVMGHELRTPMSIVRNALAMIRREQSKLGMVPPEKLAKYLNMGMDASRREISLIETLLSATKVDASRLQFHFKKVSISKGIEDAMVAQRGAIAEKGLQLVYEPPALDIALFVDQTRFQEIIDNFLSNAIKYTPTGNITIKIWQDADWGWLGIRDTGMGMDYEDLKNLGKKFFRAKQYIEKTTAGPKIVRAGGTGLGLFVTFELIRLMGGVLYVNSAVNQGTLFTIGFPLYKNQKDLHIDQSFGEITPQNRRHIVLNGNPPRHPEDMVS